MQYPVPKAKTLPLARVSGSKGAKIQFLFAILPVGSLVSATNGIWILHVGFHIAYFYPHIAPEISLIIFNTIIVACTKCR